MSDPAASDSLGPGGPLDRAFVERFSERLLAVWNQHDTTGLAALVTDDVIWIDPAQAQPARGAEGVRRFMEDCWCATPDLHFDRMLPAHGSRGERMLALVQRLQVRLSRRRGGRQTTR